MLCLKKPVWIYDCIETLISAIDIFPIDPNTHFKNEK